MADGGDEHVKVDSMYLCNNSLYVFSAENALASFETNEDKFTHGLMQSIHTVYTPTCE